MAVGKLVGVYGNMPRISEDYYQRGSDTTARGFKKSGTKFLTRQEMREAVEANFAAAYEAEMNEVLPAETTGIVVWQCGLTPYSQDFEVNPEMGTHCATSVEDMKNKVLHMPYVFESHSYWLEDGKLTPLLTPALVLRDDAVKEALVLLAAKLGWEELESHGICDVQLGRHQRPCRVYRIDAGRQYCLINLTNGVIHIEDTPPDMAEVKDENKFTCGYIYFRKVSGGYIKE